MAKNSTQLKAILADFIKLVKGSVSLYAVVLFGSYARGSPAKFSDIDVAVFSPDFGINPLEEMKTLLKLRRKVDLRIEPLPFSKNDFLEHAKTDFIEEILRHGKLIYKEGRLFLQDLE